MPKNVMSPVRRAAARTALRDVPEEPFRADTWPETRENHDRMTELTMSNYKPFVSEGTRTLKVATVRKDGRPHVAPVWFVVDGDGIVFTTSENSVKGKDLLRDPRVSLLVENEEPTYGMRLSRARPACRQTLRTSLIGIPAWPPGMSAATRLKRSAGAIPPTT